MTLRIAIIGGGLGGIASALRLSAAGHRVTLCEAGPTLGGKMNRWQTQGFTFDTGPSLVTMPWVFAEIFESAGERIEDHLELVRLDPVAEYIYPDGTRFEHSTSLPHWLEVLRQIEPRDVDGFLRVMRLGARLFELSSETFLRRGMDQPPDWRTFKALRHLPLRNAWGSYDKAVRSHFRSPHLRQMFNRYPTYVGSSPYRAPATLLVIPYMEHAFGGWFVKGGLYRIVEALAALARNKGAELHCSAPVERIVHERGRTRGVALADGRRIDADVVVMNGDAGMLPSLLGEGEAEPPPAQRSLSGFLTLAAMRDDLPSLHHHTVCFSADYRREFEQLFDRREFPDDPTVYVNAPSRSDRAVVPGRGETLFIMANAPADTETWNDAAATQAFQRVQQRLSSAGLPDIAKGALALDHWTPRRIGSAYRMPGGAIYGRHSHGWRNAFFRPPNRQRTRGLYLVGGSSHPGGGTPTVLMSAKITTELIARHESA